MVLVVVENSPPTNGGIIGLARLRVQIGSILYGRKEASGLTGLVCFDVRRDEPDVRHASSYKYRVQAAHS